jgi:hypothetical protein
VKGSGGFDPFTRYVTSLRPPRRESKGKVALDEKFIVPPHFGTVIITNVERDRSSLQVLGNTHSRRLRSQLHVEAAGSIAVLVPAADYVETSSYATAETGSHRWFSAGETRRSSEVLLEEVSLGRIVGVPSLWPRRGGVLQQQGLGVIQPSEMGDS